VLDTHEPFENIGEGVNTHEPCEDTSDDTDEYHIITYIDVFIINSVKELADTSDVIVKAEFVSDLGAFNASQMLIDKGYTDVGTSTICTFYELRVVEVIKGDVVQGDIIRVLTLGGLYQCIMHMTNLYEKLTNDYDYILFLNESRYDDMPFSMSELQGYLPIMDGVLSLNKTIAGWSLFTNGQSDRSIIDTIKEQMSSPEELLTMKRAEEFRRVQNSFRSAYSGVIVYEDGYSGENYKHNSNNADIITFYLYSIEVTAKMDRAPDDQIYHIGILCCASSESATVYKTITITDTAVLYNEDWYSYVCNDYDVMLSDIIRELRSFEVQ